MRNPSLSNSTVALNDFFENVQKLWNCKFLDLQKCLEISSLAIFHYYVVVVVSFKNFLYSHNVVVVNFASRLNLVVK